MIRLKHTLIAALVLAGTAVQAQLITPQPSPTATISQKVGLTDVSVTYSRHRPKARTTFGDVAPLAQIWKT